MILFRESRKNSKSQLSAAPQTSDDNPLTAHIILGVICAFFSWGGFVFFSLIEGSMAYLAKRKASEQKT